MFIQTWLLPFALLIIATLVAFPLSRYLAWILDGQYKPLPILRWFEKCVDSGPQQWKQYAGSLLFFNILLFIFSFLILTLQPWLPLNPDGKTMLAPSTIFNMAASFMTNTDLQHYAGEQHLSNFSQLFFCITNFFISSAIGLCALTAIIRALRSDTSLGNFFLDVWRIVIYVFLPIAFLLGIIFLQQGSPMTYQNAAISTLESNQSQMIPLGPVAAFESIKMLGNNGGGFYNMNSAHPFENPTAFSNFLNMLAMMIFPFAFVFMYGRMLNQRRHSLVIFMVMLFFMTSTIIWTIAFDTLQPNPGLISHPTRTFVISNPTLPSNTQQFTLSEIAALPVDQHLGNLEGKEIRFGTSAGATYLALTADVTCGAVNAEPDSLNPVAALAPMAGMWINCFMGGKGVGMINMLLFMIIGIFLAGMMVGRTPEYLGKKIGGKEVKLAILALLVHPFMILMPTGLFAATDWGQLAVSNPGAHGFSQILYQFSSATANNGSAFDGLNTMYPAPNAIAWDIATGLVMIFSRFLPMIAPIAMAAFLGTKKSRPFSIGTLRTDTFTFGFLLIGTIIITGGLLFLPVGVLGPIAEQLGPIPFGE